MRLSDYIQKIRSHPDFKDSIVYYRCIPERSPSFSPIKLSPPIEKAIRGIGIERLFSHQADAISLIREGKNVVVSTGTSSGKSLIYNISVLERILENPKARALYIFPLKALEQDQLKSFNILSSLIPNQRIRAAIYDGDTDTYTRKKIKGELHNVIFTNPDMLHMGILPYHDAWRDFFKELQFVVIDEIHTYTGIFGSHVVQIIRRLKRICEHYGSRPQFILLSATINNPSEFAKTLIQEPVELVENDGSPYAKRHFLLIDPEISPNFLASKLLIESIRSGFRTIVFTQSRRTAELIYIWAIRLSPSLEKKISSYRAGFLPEERREIERRLSSGELMGVVSTSALEMGIDIGELDICILVGYPGTIINTWQRSGRVGRSGRQSLVILISGKDALDQYFVRHPEELFERPFEMAILDPENPYVLDAHIPCAAAELPIREGDKKYWGDSLKDALRRCELSGEIVKDMDKECWYSTRKNPHIRVNIRSTGESFTIFERRNGNAIGTIDGVRAFKECHPGAIYLHRAMQYQIEHIDILKKDIIAVESDAPYFTRPLLEKETEIIDVEGERQVSSFLAKKGRLKVTERVVGYEKRGIYAQELLGVYEVELPPIIFETKGVWIEIPDEIKGRIERDKVLHFMGGIHAIEHAMIGILPFFALCDRNDVGGISYPYHPQLGRSAIFIYDGYPGGVGICSHGFEIIGDWVRRTLELIEECECENGCPSCIHSPKCGSGNKPLDKRASIEILRMLLSKEFRLNNKRPSLKKEREKRDYRIIVFDLETQKGAHEVGGWKNAHLMRVSVAVAYDSFSDRYFTFMEDDVPKLMDMFESADLVVGFNIKRFDYRVLSGYIDLERLNRLPTFDILEDIHRRLGFRLSLNHLAINTLNKEKSGNGLLALRWFKEGNMERLINYCRQDVLVTKDLFFHGLRKGYLVYKRKNRRLRLLLDWNIEEMVRNEGI